jgi:hypothetical protein
MELTEFIAARLDEDEAVARRNTGNDGLADTEEGGPGYPDYQTYDGDDINAACDFLNQFRPLRMLREIEAKRAILAEHQPYDCMEPNGQRCYRCASDRAYRSGAAIHEAWPCATLRALAAIWSDHPDYRQERPPLG